MNKVILLIKYKSFYFNYYFKNKKKIYMALKDSGVSNIKPIHKEIWKLWYNTSYYTAVSNGRSVFIKVMGELLQDCFNNEILVNKYIDDNSLWLEKRKPKLLHNIALDELYILIYENLHMENITLTESVKEDVKKAIKEYNRIGILHTDFGLTNIAKYDNKTLFIDYGTSICLQSNMIRIRNESNYNHIDRITDQAKDLCENADFYYDDAVHVGVDMPKTENINFLVGQGDLFYVKLGTQFIKFKLNYNGDVYLLKKINN